MKQHDLHNFMMLFDLSIGKGEPHTQRESSVNGIQRNLGSSRIFDILRRKK